MEKKEKVEFILEQMRLCIAVKDYIRTQIISKKINTKFFQEEGTEVRRQLKWSWQDGLCCLCDLFRNANSKHIFPPYFNNAGVKAEVLQPNDPGGPAWRLLPVYLQTLSSHLWHSLYLRGQQQVATGAWAWFSLFNFCGLVSCHRKSVIINFILVGLSHIYMLGIVNLCLISLWVVEIRHTFYGVSGPEECGAVRYPLPLWQWAVRPCAQNQHWQETWRNP